MIPGRNRIDDEMHGLVAFPAVSSLLLIAGTLLMTGSKPVATTCSKSVMVRITEMQPMMCLRKSAARLESLPKATSTCIFRASRLKQCLPSFPLSSVSVFIYLSTSVPFLVVCRSLQCTAILLCKRWFASCRSDNYKSHSLEKENHTIVFFVNVIFMIS